MIREATLSDSPGLRGIVREAWENSRHGTIPVDEQKLLKSVHRYLSSPRCKAWVSVDDDGIKGLLCLSHSELEIAKGRAVTDHVFYAKNGTGRELLRHGIKWAREIGAVMITITVSSGDVRSDALLRVCEFTYAGGCWFYDKGEA